MNQEYYDKIDENGLITDENTGLIAPFNTPKVIYQKTQWAIRNGCGGLTDTLRGTWRRASAGQ